MNRPDPATTEREFRLGLTLLYAAGALIIATQLSELILTLVPMKPGSPPWRFGAVGLTLSNTTVWLFADVLIGVAAIGRRDRQFLRVWGWIHLALGVALVAVLLGFALDVLTVRAAAQPAGRSQIALTGFRALGVGMALATFSIWAGIKLIRSTGRLGQQAAPILVASERRG